MIVCIVVLKYYAVVGMSIVQSS